jgi:hypothetical protein
VVLEILADFLRTEPRSTFTQDQHRWCAPHGRAVQPLHATWTYGKRAGASARTPATLRAQGLRPIQIWVPDVRAPEFVAEAHRQSAAIAASEHEAADQAFVDAVSVDWDDEAESTE